MLHFHLRSGCFALRIYDVLAHEPRICTEPNDDHHFQATNCTNSEFELGTPWKETTYWSWCLRWWTSQEKTARKRIFHQMMLFDRHAPCCGRLCVCVCALGKAFPTEFDVWLHACWHFDSRSVTHGGGIQLNEILFPLVTIINLFYSINISVNTFLKHRKILCFKVIFMFTEMLHPSGCYDLLCDVIHR